MRRVHFTLLLLATSFAVAQTPEISFDSVSNFFKLPANLYFGEAARFAGPQGISASGLRVTE